jgi:precorrin-6B methylase 2
MLEDKEIMKFQAYILYSRNIEDILKRIANYLENCNKIIADTNLGELLKNVCEGSEPHLIELKDYKIIEEVINREPIGKGIIFRVVSPRSDVYAIAFIPINNFNKTVVSKR